MSTSCFTTPTATTTSFGISDSVTTSFTESLSTELPTTTTITKEECGLISLPGCSPTPTTITSTVAGSTRTITIPVVSTIHITTTSRTLTFFASVCTVFPSANTSVSLSASLSTPPPVVVTSSSATTLANGQVSVVLGTITSTQPASVVFVPTNAPGSVQKSNDGSSASSNVGPIVGGVLGGFFLLLGIVLIVWFIMKRRRRWDDIFDKEDADIADSTAPWRRPTKRFSLDTDIAVEPKPYQYGLVGQSRSPTMGMSPPSSPPTQPTPGSRQHTLTPLLLPTTVSAPGTSPMSFSSRPSTAGSMRPLRDAASTGSASPPSLHHNYTTSSGSSSSVHVAPAMPAHWGHHSPGLSAGQEYFDHQRSHSLTGSVRDYEPQRRLHLANIGDGDVAQSPKTQGPPRTGLS
ncbi:hypothetical protein B0H15DRAFT_856980 [Mycena belliarum]|uniref:Transmembrane protein n=1 Tax=Mycena belliarum TaxID=1033014 RepID=A0AAD6U074_9AGAR|nr:hypothetical protein B0H15DRAFT_856980 [Mycena belliae]